MTNRTIMVSMRTAAKLAWLLPGLCLLLACDSADKGEDSDPSSATGSEDTPPTTCHAPVELNQAGNTPSGILRCENGMLFRRDSVACSAAPPELSGCDLSDDSGAPYRCETDADCDAYPGADGVCSDVGWVGRFCSCYYGCQRDEDCAPDRLCLCQLQLDGDQLPTGTPHGGREGFCTAGNCRTDDDCGGLHCALSEAECHYNEGFFCRTPDDKCQTNLDCGESELCSYEEDLGHWACITANPGCGE